ncbi:MAG: molybdenum cofactor guanylyltransferase [Elusimicrobia bacterium]|nr:molybdenum cofactor guanylyltransferase [Elusimicrobiota bacterium]
MAQIEKTGVILAGGRSSRFGSDKALAPYQGKPLIWHALKALRHSVARLYVVNRQLTDYRGLNLQGARIIMDLLPDYHPLGGVYSALRQIDAPSMIVAACDQPRLQPQYLNLLGATPPEYDLALGLWKNTVQPLPGLYRKNLLDPLRDLITQDAAGLKDLVKHVRTRLYFEGEIVAVDPLGVSFIDIDTPQDLEEFSHDAH